MFKDRQTAGQMLTFRLLNFDDDKDAIVVGLARGGVVVAAEVARNLRLPLEMLIVRKLGAPLNPEFAIGAVAEGGTAENGDKFIDQDIVREHRIPHRYVEEEVARRQEELEHRIKHYRHGRPPADFRGKTIILVDDGIATGATMHAAVQSAKKRHARYVVTAAPVISEQALQALWEDADASIHVETMRPYSFSVGEQYERFPQVGDEEVIHIMRDFHMHGPREPHARKPSAARHVKINRLIFK